MPDPARLAAGVGLSVAETHAHTLASDGMVSATELVRAAAAIGLRVLCITDHDTMRAVAEARRAGERHDVDIVAGEEVTTAGPANTHIIGLWLKHPVRMGMTMEDTVDAIHDQGGLAVLAHPLMPTFFASAGPRRIHRLLEAGRRVDGLELRHTAPMGPGGWARLDALYGRCREGLGAALGAGDSHFGRHDLGRMVTVFPGTDAADLRAAIEHRTTSPRIGITIRGPSLHDRLLQQRRSLLWLTLERRAGRVGQGAGPAKTASPAQQR